MTRAFIQRLYGVTTLSRSDAWAVGLTPDSSLILHWNGRAWSQSQAGAGYYIGVGADSATDVWAVGGTNWFSPTRTLAEHWNGTAWARVPSPSPAGGGRLSAVAAISPADAWAVGLAGPGPGVPSPTEPLIEHWNGTAWTRVPSPDVAGGYNVLNGVTATSSRNVWAGGATGFTGYDTTLIEHWDGTAWTVVPSPTPTGDAQVQGMSATRRTDAWAVGMARGDTCDPRCVTFIEHWNGTAWTPVPSPSPGTGYLDALFGVSATGRHNAWAVGTIGYSRTLMVHWNGRTWS